MKLRFLIVFIILISIIFLAIRYNDSEKEKLTAIDDGISKNINQLMNHPGVTYIGVASEKDKKFFKVIIDINREKISFEEFEEVIVSYLSSIAAYASQNDWKQVLKPYTFKIEELAGDSKNPKVIVEKLSDSTELIWKTKW